MALRIHGPMSKRALTRAVDARRASVRTVLVNVVRMQEKYGKYYYDIVPDTYCLPDEFADFYAHYHKLKATD